MISQFTKSIIDKMKKPEPQTDVLMQRVKAQFEEDTTRSPVQVAVMQPDLSTQTTTPMTTKRTGELSAIHGARTSPLAPSPLGVTTRDIITSIPGTIKKALDPREKTEIKAPFADEPSTLTGPKALTKTIGATARTQEFIVEALQWGARIWGGVPLALQRGVEEVMGKESTPKILEPEEGTIWQQVLQRSVFGEEPVKDWATHIEGVAEYITKNSRGLQQSDNPQIQQLGQLFEREAISFGAMGVFAVAALDLTGYGKLGKEGVIKALKIADEKKAFEILKRIGVPQELAQPASVRFGQLTDEKQIATALNKMDDLLKATKAPTVSAPVGRDMAPMDPVIPVPVNKFSPDLVKSMRKSPPDYVAMRTMRDGTQRPAIRKSGVFAPKEAETATIKDVRGVTFNLNDLMIAGGDTPITRLPKTGEMPFLPRIMYETNEATTKIQEFGPKMTSKVTDMIKRHGVAINETTGIQAKLYGFGLRNADIEAKGAKKAIEDVLRKADISQEAIQSALSPGFLRRVRGKDSKVVEAVKDGIPTRVQNLGNDLRKHYDELIGTVNPIRKSLNKKEIAYRENYTEAIQATGYWSKMRSQPKTEIVENFDYIIPNAKKNPHALPRTAGARDLEWNLWNSLPRYHEAIAQDLYHAPMIEQLKAINEVFKGRGLPKLSRSIDLHVRENLVGAPSRLDTFFALEPSSRTAASLNALIRARNISALSFNLIWSTFIQPASLVLATARATVGGSPILGAVYGPLHMAKGAMNWFSPAGRAKVMKLPTPRTKAAGKSIGSTGAGDLDTLGSKIMKTKVDKLEDYLKLYADAMEYHLTGISASAGYEVAERLGIKGRNADFIADWLAGASQSRYNKEARTLIQNSQLFRTNFPFNTYLFEFYRFNKTLLGKPGGMPLEWTERLNQGLVMMAGMYLYDRFVLEPVLGRRLLTPSVFVPAVGQQVEYVLNRGASAFGITEETPVLGELFGAGERQSGQPPATALWGDIYSFANALNTYTVYGNINPLRREMTKWGMGFSGVGGAATVSRFIDGLIASTKGYQSNKAGRRLFRIEGIDKYTSLIVGPYSTRAGIEFFKEGGSIITQDARKEKRRLDNMPREEAAIEFDRIEKEYPNLARLISNLNEDEANPILAQIRGLNDEMKAEKLVELFEDIPEENKAEEYQKLIDAGQITASVTEKYSDLLEKQDEAARGILPNITDGATRSDKGIISIVSLYAKAIGTSPIDAFSKIIAGEKLRRIDNGAIIVERMAFEESERVRRQRATASELKNLRLDHIIPLQLGGTNREDNLILVSIAEWEAYTPIENLLGDHLRAGNIKRREAQKLIKQFKEAKITAEEILEKYPPTGTGTLESFGKEIGEFTTENIVDYIYRRLDSGL